MTRSIPATLLQQITSTVLSRCDELSQCTDVEGGITRLFCSPAMQQAHELVKAWMKRAGLATRVDALGNLIGRYEPTTAAESNARPRRICIGSHLDSVRNAGRYDGVLGVMLGIAVTEIIREVHPNFIGSLDIVGFSEEEGVRFSFPYLGSFAIAGKFDPILLDKRDSDGVTVREALENFGLNPTQFAASQFSTDEYVAYLEAHIEQGPVLEALEQSIGVVEAIVGQSRLWFSVEGMAGHAGTLPMSLRRDALTAAADCVLAIEEYAHETDGLVATVGGFHVSPNATNVVPGNVRFSLDVRHRDDGVRLQAVEEILVGIQEIAKARFVRITVTDRSDFAAVPMDGELVQKLTSACRKALECQEPGINVSSTSVPEYSDNVHSETDYPETEHSLEQAADKSDVYVLSSGAGHDAAVMASVIPSVMLFVRSPGGISHHPLESVRQEDVAIAISAMYQFVIDAYLEIKD